MRLVLLFLALLCVGCSAPLADATRAVNAAGDFLEGAHAPLKETHQRAEIRCVERETTRDAAEACVAHVRERYVPAWDAYDAAREGWLLAAAVVREAELIGALEPGVWLPALARLGAAVGQLRQAIERAREGGR